MYTGSKIVEDERSQPISQETQHKHVSGNTCYAAKVCCTDHRFAFSCLMPCLATAARATCVDIVIVPLQSHQQQQCSTEVHAQQATLRQVPGPNRGPRCSAPQCKLGFWSPARHTWHPITRGIHGQPWDGCAAKKKTTAGTPCAVIHSNAAWSWLTCLPSFG